MVHEGIQDAGGRFGKVFRKRLRPTLYVYILPAEIDLSFLQLRL